MNKKKFIVIFSCFCLCSFLTFALSGCRTGEDNPSEQTRKINAPSIPGDFNTSAPKDNSQSTTDPDPNPNPDTGISITESPAHTETPTQEPTTVPTLAPTRNPAEEYDLVEYNGSPHHVFFHFLISFPEIAFAPGNSYGKNLSIDCVTPLEMWRSLEELYNADYVLVDMNRYIHKTENGIEKSTIMVPRGKKPLIISFDDINYYSTTLGLGVCDKLILDSNGKFAMQTKQKDGTLLITYDNCVVPLLEAFCEQYPDFTPYGDKGLLALTGFDGILGYRTNRDSASKDSEIEAVKPIVAALKKAGWSFASHSYGHIWTADTGYSAVTFDTSCWKNEVQPLVGETFIYVYPYGQRSNGSEWVGDLPSNVKFKDLYDNGFRVFCGVGLQPFFYTQSDKSFIFMDRAAIDGRTLHESGSKLFEFYNMRPDYIISIEERLTSYWDITGKTPR